MGSMSLMHWLVVLAIVLVLFGAGKLPRVMGDFAKGIKAFKSGMKEEDETDGGDAAPAGPAAGRHGDLGRAPSRDASAAARANGARSSASERRSRDGSFGWPQRGASRAQAHDRAAAGRPTIAWKSAATRLKGRGVFARAPIGAGALIESGAGRHRAGRSAQICSITRSCTITTFVWDDEGGEGRAAVALGLVSLCNHSRRPSARVRRNRARETLDLLALTPIAAGDEITIDYNCPLWFAAED